MTVPLILRFLAAALALGLAWLVALHGLWQGREPVADLSPVSMPDRGGAGPVHIVLLGTSLTDTGGWAEALAHDLSACRAGGVSGGVMVERLAKPGANSAWGEEVLRNRLAHGPVPDAMVVEFSINDSSLWRGMTLAASRARHEAILQMARQAGVPVWLATMNPAFGRKAWERPGQVAYRALYADLAPARGGGLIAMAPVWQALPGPERQRLMPDGLHPTQAAMIRFAVPALAKALGPLVCDQG